MNSRFESQAAGDWVDLPDAMAALRRIAADSEGIVLPMHDRALYRTPLSVGSYRRRMGKGFRPLDEAALMRLGDDGLIDYVRRARTAGHASAGTALAIMVYGHRGNVERRVRMKVPLDHVEDLTADIVADAIVSAFDGSSVGAFHSWLNTITRRAIADFHRRGPGSVELDPLPEERAAPATQSVVEVHDAIDRVLAGLRDEHRRVVEQHLLAGRPVAELVAPGMSAANVHQIVRRFRLALRAELSAGGDTGGG